MCPRYVTTRYTGEVDLMYALINDLEFDALKGVVHTSSLASQVVCGNSRHSPSLLQLSLVDVWVYRILASWMTRNLVKSMSHDKHVSSLLCWILQLLD